MTRRTWLKLLHWTMLPLFVWFFVVQPDDVSRVGSGAVLFHSVLGLAFVSLALIWTFDFLWRGLASRPGPKLPLWGRRFHQLIHKVLIWGMFGVAFTGFLLGLTASRQLFAGDIVPIAVPLSLPKANALVGMIHEIEFYGLAFIALSHALFHLWRHIHLKDNALRIMLPRVFHRYL